MCQTLRRGALYANRAMLQAREVLQEESNVQPVVCAMPLVQQCCDSQLPRNAPSQCAVISTDSSMT